MDFPVEATVHLSVFPNETQVRDILRSHGFALTELGRGRVRVKGSSRELKAVRASLELLLNSQAEVDISPSSSSPVTKVSSGAVSKSYYTNNSSAGNRSRLGSPNKPSHASPSTTSSRGSSSSDNYQTSPGFSAPLSPGPDKLDTVRPGDESFVVDADVFGYAERLRKKDIDDILSSHNVTMAVRHVGDSCSVTLQQRSTMIAAAKLQSLLNDLSKSLRTQEIPLKDMDHDGNALLGKIKKNGNVHDSVLLNEQNDRLHLIGPSDKSYELKLRLLGRPVEQSPQTGQTLDRNVRARSSSSLPLSRGRKTERDTGAIADPSTIGATGYSPSKYQDDKQGGAEPKWGAAYFKGLLRRRGHSEPRQAVRTNSNVQDIGNKHPPPKAPTQLMHLNKDSIKQKLKSIRRK